MSGKELTHCAGNARNDGAVCSFSCQLRSNHHAEGRALTASRASASAALHTRTLPSCRGGRRAGRDGLSNAVGQQTRICHSLIFHWIALQSQIVLERDLVDTILFSFEDAAVRHRGRPTRSGSSSCRRQQHPPARAGPASEETVERKGKQKLLVLLPRLLPGDASARSLLAIAAFAA